MTSLLVLDDGACVRVRATPAGRVVLTIIGPEEDQFSVRVSLNTDEAVRLSSALAAAALQTETPAA